MSSTNQPSGRLMALDIGTKRIGIATCDATRLIATPRLIIHRENLADDLMQIKEFLEENQIVSIVIGLPAGYEDTQIHIKNFAKNLDELLLKKIPIFFLDESLTSFEAKQIHTSPLSRKKNKFIDDIAASLILQRFLNSHGTSS
ncbi:MAG: Holliday junction resolvase RuvX [Alphaproteobacteria bacterium]|nr:Holliday junction resolvase RuvX [Alphaproteobacteria bacterium]